MSKSCGSNYIKRAEDLIDYASRLVLAKLVHTQGSSPRKAGAWMLVREDGNYSGTVGGGILEAQAYQLAIDSLTAGETEKFTRHFSLTAEEKGGLDMRCGGEADVEFQHISGKEAEDFLKGMEQTATAYIFGAGHIGLALEAVLRYASFKTVVFDDRREFANRQRFPKAKCVSVISDYKCAASILSDITNNKESYIVIVTRGHAGDYEVLKSCMGKEFAYMGMIGSRKKTAHTFELLRHEGAAEEFISQVKAPIGLSIGAETPEEIAISIAAEMIKVRAERNKA